MEIYYNKDKLIRGDWIKKAILRSDLVPVPLTLEAEIRADRESALHFQVGNSIATYAGDELEIIYSEYKPSGKVQGSTEAAYVHLIAILKPVKGVSFIKQNAIIKYNATLAEVYRACGATLRSIEGDFSLPRFACLAGEVPTFHISRALQEAGGVVRWRHGKLAFIPLSLLLNQKTTQTITSLTDDVDSGFLERHDVPSFYSTDADGAVISGNKAKLRALRYQPGTSEMALRNMTSCLVHARTAKIKYNINTAAGDLVNIRGSQTPLAVITSATVFSAGTDGDPQQQFTKVWLGRLER